MKYSVRVWHKTMEITARYSNDINDIKEFLQYWYKKEESGDCYIEIFVDSKQLTINKKRKMYEEILDVKHRFDE